ncbi:hypothetical protein [Pseudoscardovia suis]|uniref:Uncharacterized protein n=1 Tax=Pseudoscardovia suis TaxID=987063 RepID=A0A261F167_9BIFI|nr:hypothetical protein [Pseudoscardovia suis]OZG52860.1 hypothetical protein PSSU_0478 [Pseudoscardovia suis]PJJ68364.1 hypothetical protein CLV65_0939 [Pseudoscardovia suis]
MRNTPLWKYCDAHFGARIRKRAHGESGAAMIMALLFTVMVILTLTIVTSVLVGQAIPFKTNKRTQQATYAAETGLELGLSFLRSAQQQAKADDNYQAFFPTINSQSDATMSNGRTDDPKEAQFVTAGGNTIVLDCVTQSHSDGTADLQSVMGTDTPRCPSMNSATASTTAPGTSDVNDYSAARVTYRVEITYWKSDPSVSDSTGNPAAEKVSGVTDFSNARYALVTAKAYGTRYANANKGNSQLPLITLQGIYQFGVTQKSSSPIPPGGDGVGGSSDGAFTFNDNEQGSSQHAWIKVTSQTLANDDKDVATVTGIWTEHISEHMESGSTAYIDDPANETCMVAADSSGNVSTSYTPVEGSKVRIFKRAWSNDPKGNGNTMTYTYTPQCQANGGYPNAWIYTEADTIRLAGTNLCVTGLDPYKSENYGTSAWATLQECGTSYTPNHYDSSGHSTGTKVDLLNGKPGYDTTAELNDANSALNKIQKWSFYFGFINAGWSNSTDGSTKFATGNVANGSYFSVLYPADTSVESDHGGCGSDVDPEHDMRTCYLTVGKWKRNPGATGYIDNDNERTFLQSLGHGGEAGYETSQVVSTTGACMQARPIGSGHWNVSNVVTKQCYVNAEPLTSWCYQQILRGGSVDTSKTYNNKFCGTRADNEYTKYDKITYDRPTKTDGTIDYDQTSYPVRLSWNGGCLKTDGTGAESILKSVSTPCNSLLGDDRVEFVRTEYVGKDSNFNYKFVLKSSLSGGYDASKFDSSANVAATNSAYSGALCLQEMNTNSGWVMGTNGTDRNTQQYAEMFPYVALQTCSATTTDRYGRTLTTPQQWNAPAASQGTNTRIDSGSTSTATSETSLQSASAGFMKVREYNLDALCTDSAPVSGTAAKGYSCWTV